ncbi:MAG: cytidyltransferase-like domain-containing protein, partial [Lachnospiraceae bacterium]|nr:cytidyltransferase-like domain-containing protein [Lachnospiraceae bacterium]
PFEERIEIVRSCKYTDEAVEIPAEKPGTEEAYRLYHFDVQFSGSDYANDPDWLAKRAYLRQHGSDLVFFPYTQSTSSTKLKEKIGGNK